MVTCQCCTIPHPSMTFYPQSPLLYKLIFLTKRANFPLLPNPHLRISFLSPFPFPVHITQQLDATNTSLVSQGNTYRKPRTPSIEATVDRRGVTPRATNTPEAPRHQWTIADIPYTERSQRHRDRHVQTPGLSPISSTLRYQPRPPLTSSTTFTHPCVQLKQ